MGEESFFLVVVLDLALAPTSNYAALVLLTSILRSLPH